MKTYIKPEMLSVALQQMQLLCASQVDEVDGGDTGISGPISGGTGPGRVKEHNVWDEEW